MGKCRKIWLAMVSASALLLDSGCGRFLGVEQDESDAALEEKQLPEVSEKLPPAPEASAFFRSAKSCEDFRSVVTEQSKKVLTLKLDRRRDEILQRRAMSDEECEEEKNEKDNEGSTEEGAPGDTASDASSTNNQVEGVSEADFVKNDRSHIFVLADGAFQVLDAWPPKEARVISRTEIDGRPTKMFVHNERAFIYSSGKSIGQGDPVFEQARDSEECTYGYDCDFVGDGRELYVTELDLSDLDKPKVIRRATMNGSLLGARRIGDRIYTVTLQPSLESNFSNLDFVPARLQEHHWKCGSEIPRSIEEIKQDYIELQAQIEQKLDSLDTSEVIPRIEDEILNRESGVWERSEQDNANCGSLMLSKSSDSTNIVSIHGTDLHEPAPFRSTSIFSRPGAVYANGAHLYLASRHYAGQMVNDWWFPNDRSLRDATSLHRFDLYHREKEIRYVASGRVKGRILNQFSLSHHDKHLRVATTTGRLPNLRTHNTLTVLRPRNGELLPTGVIDDIAPTEDIRSVRFRGNKGYVVTFKKTDPLFVFDLSDPQHPSIEGELKIPGFSTYMHPMGKDHLLTIGFDAEEMGNFAIFTGIQLQIMDVSNPNNPKLIHKEVIGTRGSASAATSNHLAFNYYEQRKLLALPMIVCEASKKGGGKFDVEMTFNGLLVYDLSVDDGFRRLGGLPFELGKFTEYPEFCYQWWTGGLSMVERSIFIEDYVYAVSREQVLVASSESPGNPVQSISLQE